MKTGHCEIKTGHYAENDPKTGQHRSKAVKRKNAWRRKYFSVHGTFRYRCHTARAQRTRRWNHAEPRSRKSSQRFLHGSAAPGEIPACFRDKSGRRSKFTNSWKACERKCGDCTIRCRFRPRANILTAWDELLDEFRALGGTAENIRLGRGELGRGIFPVDPARPVAIRIPPNLLVPIEDMVLANGKLRVGPKSAAGERERAWLDRYQEEFSWGGGGADEVRQIFEMAGALPEELRHTLSTKYHCGLWFNEPTEEHIRSQFFHARALTYRVEPVVIPIVELVNHGNGPNYDTTNGVAMRGIFPHEAFVQYSDFDSFDFFRSWGFAAERPLAFSVALNASHQVMHWKIEDQFGGVIKSERDLIPKIQKNPDGFRLQFLMIGNKRFPRLPKGIFYRLVQKAGYAGFQELFDMIHHTNLLHFLDLLVALDGTELPMARTLRAMAQHQLRAIAFCYGVREI